MSDDVEQFGRIPCRIVDCKGFAGMNGSTATVYLILARHANRQWVAWPSQDRIAELAGIDVRTARSAVTELERRGLVKTTNRVGGRGRTTEYRIVTNPDEIAPLSQAETRTNHCPKPGRTATETRTNRCRKPGRNHPPEQIRNRCRTDSNNAAAAGDAQPKRETLAAEPDAAVMDALILAGIGEPTRGELAQLPGISAELIRRVNKRTRARSGGTGAVVLDIRAELEAQAKRVERKQAEKNATAVASTKRLADAQADRQRLKIEQAETDALIDSLNDAELDRLKAQVIAETPAQAKQWENADPRDPGRWMLRATILRLHKINDLQVRKQ